MEYMSKSEKDWGKAMGLKKTSLRTSENPVGRIVYKAKDGRLFYRDQNHWCGTFKEYCYEIVKE